MSELLSPCQVLFSHLRVLFILLFPCDEFDGFN